MSTISIITPEGISFTLRPADSLTRSIAWILDSCIILLCFQVSSLILTLLSLLSQDLSTGLLTLVYFALSLGYGICSEWYWDGQTLGKRLLKLKVVDEEGLQLRFSQVLMRNLFRFIDALPLFYCVGGICTLFNRRSQRLGDFAARTLVINQRTPPLPSGFEPIRNKYNSFRDHPLIATRIRSTLTLQESAIALRLVLRRDTLTVEARQELYAAMAGYIKRLVTIPKEMTSHVSDEQLVRNTVEIIWTPKSSHS